MILYDVSVYRIFRQTNITKKQCSISGRLGLWNWRQGTPKFHGLSSCSLKIVMRRVYHSQIILYGVSILPSILISIPVPALAANEIDAGVWIETFFLEKGKLIRHLRWEFYPASQPTRHHDLLVDKAMNFWQIEKIHHMKTSFSLMIYLMNLNET